MSAPQPKQSKFEGARRPWLEDDSPADNWFPSAPPEQVEQCLNCERPARHCTGTCFTAQGRGWAPPRFREAPQDFREIYLSGEHIRDMMRRWHVGPLRIYAWAEAEGFLPRNVGGQTRPMPEDFAEMVEKLKTKTALRSHYTAGYRVVTRWLEELKSAAHGGGEP